MNQVMHGSLVQVCSDADPGIFGLFDFSVAPPLLYYLYVPMLLLLLIVAAYLFRNQRHNKGAVGLMFLNLAIAGWIVFSIIAWIAVPTYLVYLAWQYTYLFETLIYSFAVYLGYVFYWGNDMGGKLKLGLLLLWSPVLALSSTPLLIRYFDVTHCEGVPGQLVSFVIHPLEITSTLIVGYFFARACIDSWKSYKNREKTERMLLTGSVFLFVAWFFVFLFLSTISGIWEFEVFALLGAVIAIGFLGYTISRFKTFQLKMFGIEMFVLSLFFVVFSMLFIHDPNFFRIITVITLVLVGIIGYLLVRSTRKELATKQKGERLTRYLANANARLRELDKQKTEFVSVASHQLRGPIAAIKGYSSMIRDGSFGDVPEKLQEPIGRIFDSGKRIALMVDDFLNVTRIEQGRMTYAIKRQNLCALVMNAIQELQVLGEKKGLSFVFNCGETHEKPVWIMADEGKLQQVFSNLVDNAIKYTPEGSITLTLHMLEEHASVVVSVKDTGIGIPKDEQEKMFHKFNRASNANTATVYGTGLGLYIAKEIVRAHNGWIHIQSEGEGKGTEFLVELPLAPEETKEETKQREQKEIEEYKTTHHGTAPTEVVENELPRT
jgi:signal transduction histidine kinase